MKTKVTNLFMGIFISCSFYSTAQVSAKDYGIWQTFGEPFSISQYPELRGRLCNFRWKDLETAPGVWDWKAFDNDLASRTKDGLPVIFMVYTREDAPDWLYTHGVPKVIIKNNKGDVIGYAPYYADQDYKYYFKKMIAIVHQHVETLPATMRNKIIGVQGCFGSTGDFISYSDGIVPSQYELTHKDFSDLFREFSQYYYDEYKNTNPKIILLSNPKNKGMDDALWVVQNCPGWLKNSTLGKAFQLNDELDKASWLYDLVNKPRAGDYIRMRCEIIGGNTSSGWWKEFPYKNMFAVMCYDIYWGLDWPNESGKEITDPSFDSAFSFFNKYAGQKNPAKSTNAMCALKDGLDASDDKRFPAAKYGTVSRSNEQRYKSIVSDFTAFGARLEDPHTATLTEMDELNASGTNDVGWRIFPGNYERYLHQLTPNKTSVGYWNVQSENTNSMYGRFARGFDVGKNKNALYFDVEDAFLNNGPLKGAYPVTIEITYLDNGGGSFQLYYDAKTSNDKHAIQIKCGTSNKWKKATVTLSDAYFGNRGQNGSDFSIRSTNNKNVIFSVVELSRPKNFTTLASQSLTANTATNDTQLLITNNITANKNGLLIYPNPVQETFSVQLKDNSIITEIVMYNEAGQLLLQRTTSGTITHLHRNELNITAGVYYVKVFSGNISYTAKVVVL